MFGLCRSFSNVEEYEERGHEGHAEAQVEGDVESHWISICYLVELEKGNQYSIDTIVTLETWLEINIFDLSVSRGVAD